MHCAQREFVETSLLNNSLLAKVHVAILLDLVVIFGALHLIAGLFDVLPTVLYLQRVVEWKLLVHHPVAMIRPHVIKAHTRELTLAATKIHVASVRVTKNCTSWSDVLLHQG